MVNASEITDRETLRAWLETRPREDAVAIAWRTAARVLPLLSVDYKVQFQWSSTHHRNFYVLRQVFFAYCGESNNDAMFIDAIEYAGGMFYSPISEAAYNACSTVTLSRNTRAVSCVSRAAEAVSGNDDIWNAIPFDVSNLKMHRRGWSLELWPDTPPEWFTKADAETRSIWAREPEHWRFWTRWWDSVIEGKLLNPDLLRDIALIPDETWQQGPGPVAKAIEAIEARYLETATPNGETIFINQDGLFDRRPDHVSPAETITSVMNALGRIVSRIRKEIEEDGGNCLYAQLEPHLAALELARVECRDDARGLHDEMGAVWRNLQRQMAKHELPKGDLLIETLERVLDDGQIDLRREYEHVARAHRSRLAVRMRRDDGAASALIKELAPAVEAASAPRLGTEMVADAEKGTNPAVDPETQDVARYNFVSRLARMFNRAGKKGLEAASAADKLNKGVDAGVKLADKAEDATRFIAEKAPELFDKFF